MTLTKKVGALLILLTAGSLAGIATFILIIAAMFLLVRTFRSDPAWRPLATPTRAWAFAAVAAFFLIPLSGKAYFGLAQRAFIATCFGWMLAIALYAHRAERQATTTPEPARDPHVVHDAEIRPGAPDLSAT